MGTASTLEATVTLPTMECTRCGHTWHPAKPLMPKRCGSCKSPYWDRPRVYKLKARTGKARAKSSSGSARKSNKR